MSKAKKNAAPEEKLPKEDLPEEKPSEEKQTEEEPSEQKLPDGKLSGEETAEAAAATEDSRIPELETALKAEKDKYLRLAAEFDNYRKRSLKERGSIYDEACADTIKKILPVYDNLARALAQECSDEAFYRGVELTMTQLKDILNKCGVTEIPSVGEPFNPELHDAVMHVEDPSVGASTVVEEFEKGFMLGDKVIRCSMVKVAN
jgi:molecular chaperone GrpE